VPGSAVRPPGEPLCSARSDGGVLLLTGEIDLSNAPEVTEWVAAAVAAGVTRVDLSGVSFICAAGVTALLAGRDACLPGAAPLTVVCSPMVLRVLSLCVTEGDGLRVVAADGSDPMGGDAR
jgi:anti-anti-sigma factor